MENTACRTMCRETMDGYIEKKFDRIYRLLREYGNFYRLFGIGMGLRARK